MALEWDMTMQRKTISGKWCLLQAGNKKQIKSTQMFARAQTADILVLTRKLRIIVRTYHALLNK